MAKQVWKHRRASLDVTRFLELPPAGPLTGLAKRVLPGVQVLAD